MSEHEQAVTVATDVYCSDCKTRHDQFFTKFAEWSWHAPWWEETAQTLPEMGAVRAAGLAWRYQQQRIDADAKVIAELRGDIGKMDAQFREVREQYKTASRNLSVVAAELAELRAVVVHQQLDAHVAAREASLGRAMTTDKVVAKCVCSRPCIYCKRSLGMCVKLPHGQCCWSCHHECICGSGR